MFFGKYMTLFLCVINEIIMKIKLNKIVFKLVFCEEWFVKPDIDDIQIRPSVGVTIDGKRMFIQ